MKADINGERAQKLLSAEEQTLKMIARGAVLNDVSNNLCDMIDAQAPDTISTVLLMDPDGKQLRPAAGIAYSWVGLLRHGGVSKKPVINSDIATDPL